jgi:putative acetyltransferase
MAVLPDWQHKGVGTKLINAGLQECEKAGCVAVAVPGHADYYPRFGFVPAVSFGIESEYDVPPDVFMLKELHKDVLKDVTGTIKYHQAFNDVSHASSLCGEECVPGMAAL